MIRRITFLVMAAFLSQACMAQVGGGSIYNQGQAGGRAAAEQNERQKRVVSPDEKPASPTSFVLDASVLINVQADEYVATFGVNQEGTTPQECLQKMDATIEKFSSSLKALGVGTHDVSVDYVALSKSYGYEVTSDIAKEKLVGFDLKKNVMVHYTNKAMLDKLIAAAAVLDVYDLIKVDYIVTDIAAVHSRLIDAAAAIIKRKAAAHGRLFGVALKSSPQLLAEKYTTYSPSEMYDSFSALETEEVNSGYYHQKYIVQGARKSRTFYFSGLNARLFDQVINPLVMDPPVQFTLYLKMRYDIAAAGKK